MWLDIVCNRSGESLVLRKLRRSETEDLRELVRQWARDFSADCLDHEERPSFSEPGSYIPNGCGDYQAEIRRTKRSDGFSCWTSEPFYLEPVPSEESADG